MDGAPPNQAVTLWTHLFFVIGGTCVSALIAVAAVGAFLIVQRRKGR